MGGWLAILSLTLLSFAIAVFTLRLPREGFAVFGAFLLFGLVGYAQQGSPQQPGSPKEPDIAIDKESGEQMVELRHQLTDPNTAKPNYIVFSDGYARQGHFSDAAGVLRQGLKNDPNNLEGWLALGMALTAHADGVVTPASYYAYGKARAIDPGNPLPDMFMAQSFMQTGQFRAARDTLANLLARTEGDEAGAAPWRVRVEQEVARLDQMIANAPMLQ